MILEPIVVPVIGEIDDDGIVGGSAYADLAADNFTISTSTDANGYPIYTVEKTREIVFDAYNGRYTFDIITTCSTNADGQVSISVGTRLKNVYSYNLLATTVRLYTYFDGSKTTLHAYAKSISGANFDNTLYTQLIKTKTISNFFYRYGGFESWKTKIDSGEYKQFGADFTGVSGYKKINNTWYHISYLGDGLLDSNLVIEFFEDNLNVNNQRTMQRTLSVPFSDNPFPVGLPVLELSVSNILENSITYTIDTQYNFVGSIAGYLSILQFVGDNGGYLRHIESKQLSCTKNDLPLTGTISGLSLQAGANYYLGGGTYSDPYAGGWTYKIPDDHYDIQHNVNGKFPYNNGSAYHAPRITKYGLWFVSDAVQYDSGTNAYYGGYGVNAIPFSLSQVDITGIQISNSSDISDVDLTGNYISFPVNVGITPSNWTRAGQQFTITSSNPSVVGVKSSGGGSMTKKFTPTDETKVTLYAYGAGQSVITFKSSSNNSLSASVTVNVHIPVSSCDPVNYQVDTGVRQIIDLSSNTLSGLPTTDKILDIVEASDKVNASIVTSNYKQISVVALPYGTTTRTETIVCSVGDTYGNDTEVHDTFTITLEVMPMPEASKFTTNVPDMLTFDSIGQMYRNLTPIRISLNALSSGRWNEVDSLSNVVNVARKYSMSYAELMDELDNLESDIKQIIEPISEYLADPENTLTEQEASIRDAISVLYPDYPESPLTGESAIQTASFDETLVGGVDGINRHEFIQSRFDWCNQMIDALGLGV